MSYEYSSESRRLDVPNPFKVENIFYMAASTILILSAIALLLMSRAGLTTHATFWSLAPLLVGIFLLLKGLDYGRRSLMQLRFYFGRGEPKSLASEIQLDQFGKGEGADKLKETLRQNALTFLEPQGALNGLLYSWIQELIFAPIPIQAIAQRQFQTAIAILITLISFLIAWIGFSNSASSSWMGLFYFGFTAFLLIRPLEYGATSKANLSIKGLVGLILASIFGPVIIPLFSSSLPDISWLSLNGQAFFLLLAAIVAVGLFFVALTKQMIAPPPTTMACEQQALSMNSHPKQLLDELDREMQKEWTEQIPNRRYSRVLPNIGNGTGSFAAEILEETQPIPRENLSHIDLASCFSLPRYKWLAWLDGFGLSLTLAGTVSFIFFAVFFKPEILQPGVTAFLTFGLALLIVGSFCFKAGHALWGRFDFVSELIWVEMSGNYQSAKLDYGNQFTDRVKTEKQVINIETMTLRVWITQLETVSFDKNSDRYLVGMRGLPDKAKYLGQHITRFAGNQSIIVAPTSNDDMLKVAALGAINQGGAKADASLPQSIAQAINKATGVQETKNTLSCANCSEPMELNASFCSGCGTRLLLG